MVKTAKTAPLGFLGLRLVSLLFQFQFEKIQVREFHLPSNGFIEMLRKLFSLNIFQIKAQIGECVCINAFYNTPNRVYYKMH